MPITNDERNLIANKIQPIFDAVVNDYDFNKYPADDYLKFKQSFSNLACQSLDIADALVWKWGHTGKENFPQRHRDLIATVIALWPDFIVSECTRNSSLTFQWWRQRLNKTSFVTVAYITHLVHHQEPLPIIDQHNFRAMNAFIRDVRPNEQRRFKLKPSNWDDIVTLKGFMESLILVMGERGYSDMDRFLMMYGRNHVPRG